MDITIGRRAGAFSVIRIATVRVGVPGSRLTISVDRRRPILSILLDRRECHFDGAGSVCRVAFTRRAAVFGRILHAVRTGRIAHVTVENAGKVAMSADVTLDAVAGLHRTARTPNAARCPPRTDLRPTPPNRLVAHIPA